MSAQLEQFLGQVREALELPAKKADLLVEELRSCGVTCSRIMRSG